MHDTSQGAESVLVEKYSAVQVAFSAARLGREPSADELRAHHDAPGDGVWQEAGQ